MRWARIENGIVVELTGIDPRGRFVPEIEQQFVSCGENVEQGHRYVDGTFTVPVVEPQVTTPPVDQDIADLWQAMLAMSAELETLKGGQ